MCYEKTVDLSALRESFSSLEIVGEEWLQFWENQCGPRDDAGVVRRGVPQRKFGLEGFVLQVFIRLKEQETKAEISKEVFRTFLALVTTNSHKDALVEPKHQELLMTMMWYWQKILDPSAIRPHSEESDDLVGKMEAMQHIFEGSAGFEVMAGGSERPSFLQDGD